MRHSQLCFGVLQEAVVNVEYILATTPPQPGSTATHPDWVSAVDASIPGYAATLLFPTIPVHSPVNRLQVRPHWELRRHGQVRTPSCSSCGRPKGSLLILGRGCGLAGCGWGGSGAGVRWRGILTPSPRCWPCRPTPFLHDHGKS